MLRPRSSRCAPRTLLRSRPGMLREGSDLQQGSMLRHGAGTFALSADGWADCLQGTPGLIYGPAVDLWSVGIVLFILLGGARSFCVQHTAAHLRIGCC